MSPTAEVRNRIAGMAALRQRLVTAVAAGRVPHVASDLVERVGGPLHDMEGVHGQPGVQAAGVDYRGDPLGSDRAPER